MDRRFSIRRVSAIASRSIFTGLILFLFAVGSTRGQSVSLPSIRNSFNNGQFGEVVRLAPYAIAKTRHAGSLAIACEVEVLQAHSLMRLERYEQAAKVLDEALTDAERAKHPRSIASVHLAKASLARVLRDFPSALKFARLALTAAPADPQIGLEYHLAIGRVMYSYGYDIAAIVWLERAEKLSARLPMSSARLDVLGYLSFAWASKFNYAKAIEYGETLVSVSEKTDWKYLHRLSLYDHAGLLDAVGQKRRAAALYERGLQLAISEKDDYQSCLFISTQMLASLYEGDSHGAEKRLMTLNRVDRTKRFQFESILGKAVIAGLRGQKALSDNYFKELEPLKAHSDFLVPHWKSILFEKRKDWSGLIAQLEIVLKATEEGNFRDDLPGVFFGLAKGYWGLGKKDLANEHARRSAAIIENDRPTGDAPLSLSMLETYHSVYRLLAEISDSQNDAMAALALADYYKARVLRDRIENSALRRRSDLVVEVRKRVEELSRRLIEGSDVREELAAIERSVTLSSSRDEFESKSAPGSVANIEVPTNTAIISYLFSLDGVLRAYVVEPSRPIRVIRLSITEKEADAVARATSGKINGMVYFKKDGKELYDKLIAPLAVNAEHLILIPDKSLWRIPFHALSKDGQTYLIETLLVSYAPSAGMLVENLKRKEAERKTMHVFANDAFGDRSLKYAYDEARMVAGIFGTRPVVNARAVDFKTGSQSADMLHLSMHSELDPEEPLNSFLAFRRTPIHDGRLSVEDLLSVKLKRGSFVFLASCETNNVLNGEGLVSLAWAMMGSGATSVVSAQWEANDRSAAVFAEHFYRSERKGDSLARSMQAASTAMIRDKKSGTHEPYYWAPFTLLGDFR